MANLSYKVSYYDHQNLEHVKYFNDYHVARRAELKLLALDYKSVCLSVVLEAPEE